MSRSKFSNYRRAVAMILIKDYHWKTAEAKLWVKTNRTYMWEMFSVPARHYKAAELIHKMKQEE